MDRRDGDKERDSMSGLRKTKRERRDKQKMKDTLMDSDKKEEGENIVI